MRKFLLLLVFLMVFPTVAFADSKSDFDYQFSKYREHYLEYTLFKKDYLSNPTLDNQQKALLTIKQSLSARDLAKGAFAAHVRDLILFDKVSYPVLTPIVNGLTSSQAYYQSEAKKSLGLVTLTDVDTYDKDYLKNYLEPEKNIKLGIVASKIAKLKYFLVQEEASLLKLKSKLPDNLSLRVAERLTDLENGLVNISEKIDAMSNLLVSEEGRDNTESEIFYTSKLEPLSEIRTLQLNWLDLLIDLDLNYGKI